MTAPTLSPYTRAQFLDRARSALNLRVLYWLGSGGSSGDAAIAAEPGTALDPERALADKRRQPEYADVARQYDEAMRALGLRFSDLPRVACDCSGFVAWALGVVRSPQPLAGGWLNTDSVYADAVQGRHTQFEPVAAARPGDFLVFPTPGRPKPGHIGIVSAVDAAAPEEPGRALRIIHCAPDNFRIAQADGSRTAIAETDLAIFDANPATRIVAYRRFAA